MRQEGFTRLAAKLEAVKLTADPVRDLAALGAAYVSNALANPDVDPLTLATQSWTIGHGLVSLVATGPLPRQALDHGAPMLTALFTSCGDDPGTCHRSVELGWRPTATAE